jgi:putative phage-type endonuclease
MLTEAQLKSRLTGIGGDDAAAIVGKHPFRTAFEVAQRLTGQLEPEDIGDRDIILFGNEMESVLARIYAKRNKVEVYEPEGVTYVHEKYPFLIAHLDRRLKDDPKRALECKNVGAFVHERWGDPGTDAVPERVILQVHHYMMVVPEIEVFDVVNCVGGNRYNQYTVPKNPELAAALLDIELEFHSNLQKGILPEPDWLHSTTTGVLTRLNNQIEGAIEVKPALVSWTTDYQQAQEKATFYKDLAESIKNHVRFEMGNAGTAVVGDYKWVRKKIKKVGYTVAPSEYIDMRLMKPRAKKGTQDDASDD